MVIIAVVSTFGIIYVIRNHENYGASITKFFLVILLSGVGIIVTVSYTLSYEPIFPEWFALRLWSTFIIVSTLVLVCLSSMHSLLIEETYLKYAPTIYGGFLGGIIISRIHFPESIAIYSSGEGYTFAIVDSNVLLLIVFFCLGMIIWAWTLQLRYVKIKDKILIKKANLMIVSYTLAVFLHMVYLLTQFDLLKEIQLLLYFGTSLYVIFTIVKNPDIFVSLTNEVYNFIIFHRSGILLYSYNFQTGKETDDSILKGSILIGINHILANFMNKKDQVSIIKMKNRDIVLEFDRDYGYALLVIVKKKDQVITKAISRFMTRFKSENREYLEKLSGLIDISGFKNTTELIYEIFRPFITGKN